MNFGKAVFGFGILVIGILVGHFWARKFGNQKTGSGDLAIVIDDTSDPQKMEYYFINELNRIARTGKPARYPLEFPLP